MALASQHQRGQTLIETVVAIAMLTTGVISAMGLAVYSFSSANDATNEVVGTELASQGIAGVKTMRDSNWLNAANDPLVTCAEFGSGQCHANWLGWSGDANLISPGTYTMDFLAYGANPTYQAELLNPATLAAGNGYRLFYNAPSGQYTANQVSPGDVLSVYSRMVTITEYTSSPPAYLSGLGATYSAANPLVVVTSAVWWSGHRCPIATDPSTLPSSCKVVLEMHLTNWRNF